MKKKKALKKKQKEKDKEEEKRIKNLHSRPLSFLVLGGGRLILF